MIYHDLPVLLREVSLPHEVLKWWSHWNLKKKNSVPYTPHESQRWQPLPAPMRGFEVLVCPMREKSWLIVTCGVDHLAAFLRRLGIGVVATGSETVQLRSGSFIQSRAVACSVSMVGSWSTQEWTRIDSLKKWPMTIKYHFSCAACLPSTNCGTENYVISRGNDYAPSKQTVWDLLIGDICGSLILGHSWPC